MRYGSGFTALYDANGLYSVLLRDILVTVAGTGLFRAKWTDRIHEQWMDAVMRDRPDLSRKALQRTR